MQFHGSRLKIERARKHIGDIESLVVDFTHSDDFHSVSIEYDNKQRTNHLRFDVHTSRFPGDNIALAIGDALHNLRSALDFLWYEIVSECGGVPTKWTRFPVRDSTEELIAVLDNVLNKKQITLDIYKFVLDGVKPCKAGNYLIWGLDDLNIGDKHKLLVPVLKLMRFDDVRLEDEKGSPLYENTFWIMDKSCSIRLREADDIMVTVKDKGHATATIVFDIGVPFQGEAVISALHRITEEATRTVKGFALLLGKT